MGAYSTSTTSMFAQPTTTPRFVHLCCSWQQVLGDVRPKRAPFDNEYLLGVTLQQKHHIAVAAVMLVLCTASNLAAPVLSGMMFEILVQQQPLTKYAEVRPGPCLICRAHLLAHAVCAPLIVCYAVLG
jgi:hypothetical protein